MTATMLDHALAYAREGLEVFPLAGKAPAIKGGRGCLDATSDLGVVASMWAPRPAANIGVHVPETVLVLDVDPRHDGHLGLVKLEFENGPLPATRTALSGRGDGGRHLWFTHPGGRVSHRNLPRGLDVKVRGGYVVVPPSIHPDTGQPYRWVDPRPPAPLPEWLAVLLRPAPKPLPSRSALAAPAAGHSLGGSVADAFVATTTWGDVLEPFRWTCAKGNGDEDGSVWLHGAATSSCSATVRHSCLFVYSSSTEFETTSKHDVHGYTRFRAWATLAHAGDLSAAARDLVLTATTGEARAAGELPARVLDAVASVCARRSAARATAAREGLERLLGATR